MYNYYLFILNLLIFNIMFYTQDLICVVPVNIRIQNTSCDQYSTIWLTGRLIIFKFMCVGQ